MFSFVYSDLVQKCMVLSYISTEMYGTKGLDMFKVLVCFSARKCFNCITWENSWTKILISSSVNIFYNLYPTQKPLKLQGRLITLIQNLP